MNEGSCGQGRMKIVTTPPFSAYKAGRERFHNEDASGGHADGALDLTTMMMMMMGTRRRMRMRMHIGMALDSTH